MHKSNKPTLSRPHLVAALVDRGLTRTQATAAINTLVEAIKDAVADGMPVQLRGFATFYPRHAAARRCRNPQNGAEVLTAARRRPGCKVSKAWRLDEG